MNIKRIACVGAAVFGVTASTAVASASASTINEAGSSLVYPLVAIWQAHYSGASIAPAAGGSGAGQADIENNSVDIGGSDAPITSVASLTASSDGTTIEIPWALTATGVGYNIPGVPSGLHLTATIMADIYTGKITSWGSSAITKLNKKYAKKLKAAGKITPVFRSDGSGDSFAFQNFLKLGAPKVWTVTPSTTFGGTVGQGENGNAGVAGEVHQNKGAVGYISASYLIQQDIHVAAIENAAKNFELPNGKNILNAADSDSTVPTQGATFTADYGVPIQYPSKKYKIAYPISTYTYALVNNGSSPHSGSVGDIQAFLTWAISSAGQKLGGSLDFVPLPNAIRSADAGLISGL